jgi:hypothetical protein
MGSLYPNVSPFFVVYPTRKRENMPTTSSWKQLVDARYIIVILVHLLALILLPQSYRWILATAFPAAAVLAYFKPDDRKAVLPFLLGMIGAASGVSIFYKLLFVLSLDTPDPEGATLYSLALWALGLAGVTYMGYLVYIARYLFWEKQGSFFKPRIRGTDVVDSLKRR